MTWQPIKTAPKTDYPKEPVRFLVFRDLGDMQYIGIATSHEWKYYELNNYLYWMPLPEKPTS